MARLGRLGRLGRPGRILVTAYRDRLADGALSADCSWFLDQHFE